VESAGRSFLSSSLVVNETISLLQQRGYFSAAIEWLREIRRGAKIQILALDPALQAQAWAGFELLV
jgi:predicted nucleic acid-binding protein